MSHKIREHEIRPATKTEYESLSWQVSKEKQGCWYCPGWRAPHLDAVGLLDSEHFTVLLGSGDGHGFTTLHWVR